jgi:hypothetical protein
MLLWHGNVYRRHYPACNSLCSDFFKDCDFSSSRVHLFSFLNYKAILQKCVCVCVSTIASACVGMAERVHACVRACVGECTGEETMEEIRERVRLQVGGNVIRLGLHSCKKWRVRTRLRVRTAGSGTLHSWSLPACMLCSGDRKIPRDVKGKNPPRRVRSALGNWG